MVAGRDKTALIDAGMAYCAPKTAENIARILNDRADSKGRPMTLDYILMSHTHYDHVGGIPSIKERWPEAVICGSGYAHHVLQRDSALRVIRRLGEEARLNFDPLGGNPATTQGLSVERILADGDKIPLGGCDILALETGGHTNCSMTFVLEPYRIMFASESTGVLEGEEAIHGAVLKSAAQARASLEKCRAYAPARIISPHFGLVPAYYTDRYWKLFEECMEAEGEFIRSLDAEGLTEQEMIARFVSRYWVPERAQEQPMEAFLLNARNIIRAYLEHDHTDSGFSGHPLN